MANFDKYTYTIGDHFLPALINGDISGLTDHDIDDLERFLSSDVFLKGHWSVPDCQESDFARCDISGLLSTCVDMSFYKLIEEN